MVGGYSFVISWTVPWAWPQPVIYIVSADSYEGAFVLVVETRGGEDIGRQHDRSLDVCGGRRRDTDRQRGRPLGALTKFHIL